jgi:GTP-binding protein
MFGHRLDAEFIVSAFSERDFPRPDIPEIVIAGRSNVGKSSLINRLTGQQGLARTSSTPGKTQSINFYRVSRTLYLVDLPGFGYAKVSKSAARHWRHLVEQYFRERPAIALVLQLVDSRIPPTRLDMELSDWLDHLGIEHTVVATKADKLSGNERARLVRSLSEAFGTGPVIISSAVTGIGCREIWNRVAEATRSKLTPENPGS